MSPLRPIFGAILAICALAGAVPKSSHALNERLREYAAARITEFDRIPVQRRRELEGLSLCIDRQRKTMGRAQLIFICTHNSRRSHFCQIWATAAAAYYGVPHVESFSGGVRETAFNPRAVAALRRAGFSIDEPKQSRNPRYRVRYCPGGPSLECFSKTYWAAPNPTVNFCAVMTCKDADELCPVVSGASQRISLPFDDPRVFDGTPQEAAKYDERCQQIAREMLFLFSRVAQ